MTPHWNAAYIGWFCVGVGFGILLALACTLLPFVKALGHFERVVGQLEHKAANNARSAKDVEDLTEAIEGKAMEGKFMDPPSEPNYLGSIRLVVPNEPTEAIEVQQ